MNSAKRFPFVVLISVVVFSLLLAACQPAATPAEPTTVTAPTQAVEEAEPTMAAPTEAAPTEVPPTEAAPTEAAETPTEAAEESALPENLGTEENPIAWAVVPSGETERVVSGFEKVAQMIFEETGIVIEPFVATEYAGVIEAMCSNPPQAQMGSLATFAHILASERGCSEANLVAERFGSPTYNGQIIAGADSGIESIEDLEGKTFCRPDPLSTSGWVIPAITMRAAGIDPDTDLDQIVDAGSHDAVVSAVYNGDCDAGSTYVDARTIVEETLPDVMDKVNVVEISIAIPNDGIQFVPEMDEELRQQIVDALLAIAETEEGKEALNEAYEWDALQEVDDSFYDPFRQVLDAAGVNVEDLQ